MADRIRVSHVGSLPRPDDLLEANAKRLSQGGDLKGFDSILSNAVDDVVKHQVDLGVDIPNDGEFGKAMAGKVDYGAWWFYSFQRLGGLEIRDDGMLAVPAQESKPGDIRLTNFVSRRDMSRFAEAYSDPTSGIHLADQDSAPKAFPVVTSPVTYIGQDLVQNDIANLKRAMEVNGVSEGFLSSISPGSAARIGNAYYKTEEELIFACADALHEEYKAIVDAGLTLQIDDPSIAENFDQITPEPSVEDYRKFTQIRVDAINHAVRGLPKEKIRVHICWGSWHGPHTTDIEFRNIADLMLGIDVGGYSFEAANARHEHEWKIWEDLKLPEGKVILPGIVGHATNVVEHPDLVAERIERFAKVVGPENVIASTDCGLGGRVHSQIAWAKLETLAKGAEIASKRLFS